MDTLPSHRILFSLLSVSPPFSSSPSFLPSFLPSPRLPFFLLSLVGVSKCEWSILYPKITLSSYFLFLFLLFPFLFLSSHSSYCLIHFYLYIAYFSFSIFLSFPSSFHSSFFPLPSFLSLLLFTLDSIVLTHQLLLFASCRSLKLIIDAFKLNEPY